ncbi:N-acetylmuramic acid 6-phosphate etherase [Nitrospirillum amazonense]|uniref:N-acetylmuramic acid 6-phosphate etherase n=1 Tax=Nitrospirillum amazonense TaxID=28077 RepID=A0A560JDC0_9PROT|nr:N-acetylmuramic acid 6-phosphate etherase [Nitrospirillum amazonense]MDG3439007.1 N-acetylmuramic acid 6-phosphate etherase [Nitrospirillum amazonense]TWB69191.1 N-acetylmuramic acid 6-phosphate etherase [Nitrospirillum amazonense]
MSTETYGRRFVEIAEWPTKVALEAMLEGQLAAVSSVYGQLDRIAAASEAAAERLRDGGRIVYMGAGTSGRIAVQDGVELTPTYNWPADRLVFVLAGGTLAVTESVEGAEDDEADARAQIAAAALGPHDVAIGVAASGRTPFTVAGIEAARAAGALTIGIANNPGSILLNASDHPILAETGGEPIAGSTRMKAGTAQKVVLNLLSTTMMLRLGLVYRGLMVDMRVSNEKLARRACGIVQELTGVSEVEAEDALKVSDYNIRKAVLVASGRPPAEADALLTLYPKDLKSALAHGPL